MNKLIAGAIEYRMGEVTISSRYFDENDVRYLMIDILTDEVHAGVALNCISLRGVKSLYQLQNRKFMFARGMYEDENELGESVVFRSPNLDENLEIDKLEIGFGEILNLTIPVKINALCSGYREGEIDIPVSMSFHANMEKEVE